MNTCHHRPEWSSDNSGFVCLLCDSVVPPETVQKHIRKLEAENQRLRDALIFAFDYMTGNVDAKGLDKFGDNVAALLGEILWQHYCGREGE